MTVIERVLLWAALVLVGTGLYGWMFGENQ